MRPGGGAGAAREPRGPAGAEVRLPALPLRHFRTAPALPRVPTAVPSGPGPDAFRRHTTGTTRTTAAETPGLWTAPDSEERSQPCTGP